MFDKNIEIDMDSLDAEPSDAEIFCLMLFIAIVEFIFGFMVGISF